MFIYFIIYLESKVPKIPIIILSMATRSLDSQMGGGGGKIEGRHILIIALSEHHVDYMNHKGWPLRYYARGGGHFHRCGHRIAWTRAWRQGSGKL